MVKRLGPLLRPQDLGTPTPSSSRFSTFHRKGQQAGQDQQPTSRQARRIFKAAYLSFRLVLCLSWPESEEEENKPKQITFWLSIKDKFPRPIILVTLKMCLLKFIKFSSQLLGCSIVLIFSRGYPSKVDVIIFIMIYCVLFFVQLSHCFDGC